MVTNTFVVEVKGLLILGSGVVGYSIMVRSKSRIQKWCGLMRTYVKDSLEKNMIFYSLGLNCPKLGAVITA